MAERSETRDFKGIVERAYKFDMSQVLDRYEKETRLPEDAIAEHEREIKRFLAMCSYRPGKYGMRGPLDELWHTFIIFTEKYQNFCTALGGNFIHHYPVIHKEGAHAQRDPKTAYKDFLRDYEELFGEKPAKHLWPGAGGGVMDPSCSDCGAGCDHKCLV